MAVIIYFFHLHNFVDSFSCVRDIWMGYTRWAKF